MEPILWPIMLLLAACGFAVLELFIPSGGILGVLALICAICAIVTGFLVSIQCGVILMGAVSIGTPLLLAAAVKWWPHTPIGRLILIPRPASPDEVLPEREADRGLDRLVGRRGVSKTKMLPGGVVTLAGSTFDAVSVGMPIDAGTPVEVVSVRMHRLVVRPAQGPPDDKAAASDDVLAQPIDSFGLEDLEDPLS